MPAKKEVVEPKTEFQFFGEVDLNKKGQHSSDMPAWTFTQLIEDLEYDVRVNEINLEDTSLGPEARGKLLSKSKEMKERLDNIKSSKPKVDNDVVHSVVGSDMSGGSLGDKIAESMFTRDQMMKGIAEPREEARRMTEPIIKLEGREREMALGCGVKPNREGKVSRDEAIKVWKIGRKYLGELSNAELLRK
jgi:hypothetical protein